MNPAYIYRVTATHTWTVDSGEVVKRELAAFVVAPHLSYASVWATLHWMGYTGDVDDYQVSLIGKADAVLTLTSVQ